MISVCPLGNERIPVRFRNNPYNQWLLGVQNSPYHGGSTHAIIIVVIRATTTGTSTNRSNLCIWIGCTSQYSMGRQISCMNSQQQTCYQVFIFLCFSVQSRRFPIWISRRHEPEAFQTVQRVFSYEQDMKQGRSVTMNLEHSVVSRRCLSFLFSLFIHVQCPKKQSNESSIFNEKIILSTEVNYWQSAVVWMNESIISSFRTYCMIQHE